MKIEREKLLQLSTVEKLVTHKLRPTEMLLVYETGNVGDGLAIYSYLAPIKSVANLLKETGWEMGHASGMPCSYNYFNPKRTQYFRYGNDEGFEPLYFIRSFSGIFQGYTELNEEFRLFHNLFEDKKGHFYKVEENGDTICVASISENQVHIRQLEIQQFLAIKEMVLVLQFDNRESSRQTLQELSLSNLDEKQVFEDNYCYTLDFQEMDYKGVKSNSLLMGKKIMLPLSKESSGFEGFDKANKKFIEFIIDVDEKGEEITASPNPQKLNNFFNSSPGYPQFLTPVSFRKEVLDKYHNGDQYQVGDSRVSCGQLWGLTIDNHHDDKVCVWLGDLADLPYKEQLYWQSYNTVPSGTISETFFRRQLMAEFTNSEEPDHDFPYLYSELRKNSQEKLGFSILKPLHKSDEYCLTNLHIPTSEMQSTFDTQIKFLTKVLIDSINEKELQRLLVLQEDSINGSINKLQRIFEDYNIKDYEVQISFLRDLQTLRSTSEAHRKGREYEKAIKKQNSDNLPLVQFMKKIFIKANEFLVFLTQACSKISASG